VNKPCLECGRLTDGSYCPSCTARRQQTSPRMRGRRWMRKRGAVMRRAGSICERCGERVAEEVHHLGELSDNRLDRLIAVCKPCHLQLEAEKRLG
jgi:5-methylcytosine-specific restriction endonuclease McrA